MNELKRFEASALWRANVAHEMGGPLNAILNHAEALLGNREAVQTALQGIVTHVEQMIRLRQALSVADEERWRY